jgi:hypothetical protein
LLLLLRLFPPDFGVEALGEAFGVEALGEEAFGEAFGETFGVEALGETFGVEALGVEALGEALGVEALGETFGDLGEAFVLDFMRRSTIFIKSQFEYCKSFIHPNSKIKVFKNEAFSRWYGVHFSGN